MLLTCISLRDIEMSLESISAIQAAMVVVDCWCPAGEDAFSAVQDRRNVAFVVVKRVACRHYSCSWLVA